MNNGMKWMILGALALNGIALVAQAPAGGSVRRQGGGFVAATYDHEPPVLPANLKSGGVLIYSKTNGFRDDSGVVGSDTALAAIAHERGYSYFVTENGAVMNKEQLAKFKLVIWNNNSGDTLTPEQREAFKTWVENGGSYVGTHGAAAIPNTILPTAGVRSLTGPGTSRPYSAPNSPVTRRSSSATRMWKTQRAL
jgi:hypothetical protein